MLSDRISLWIDEALDRICPGENISYEIGLTMVPGQHGGPVPALLFALWLPGALLGQHITHAIVHNGPPSIDEATVDELVRGAVAAMLAERTRQLTTQNGGTNPFGHPLQQP